jgi:hypothetical protein
MAKFTHYLVTRFNVPVESWHHDQSGNITRDENWFRHRLGLFQQYCVASVFRQSVKNFQWVIYCDRATPPDQLKSIDAAVEGVPNVQIRFVENLHQLVVDFKMFMSQSETPFVISSRLDNDDALGNDFIRLIQEAVDGMENAVINFDGGLFYDQRHKVMTLLKSDITNPFISLVERFTSPGNLVTTLGFHHNEVPGGFKVIHVNKGFHWLRIIHSRNVRSTQKGRPIFNTDHQALNAFNKKDYSISIFQTLLYIVKRKWRMWTS